MSPKYLLVSFILSQLLMVSVSKAEQVSGRLFSTPNERIKLDFLRQTSKVPGPEEIFEEQEVVTAAPVLPGSVSLQGYVKRGDGKKGTIWVNNQPVQENSAAGDVRVGSLPRMGGQVQINIPASGRNVKLKAGQVYTPETDSISEDRARATTALQPDISESGAIGAFPGEAQ